MFQRIIYYESKLVSISSFNCALFIVPSFMVGLPSLSAKQQIGDSTDIECAFQFRFLVDIYLINI